MQKFNANIKYILGLGWFKYVNIKFLDNNKLTITLPMICTLIMQNSFVQPSNIHELISKI